MVAISQFEAFLQAIIEEPQDDPIRLIAADWLDENGQPERAEFIRVQCGIAELEKECWCGGCVKKRGGGQHTNGPCAVDQERIILPSGRSTQAFLRRRERELLALHGAEWVRPIAEILGLTRWGNAGITCGPNDPQQDTNWTFRRGFICAVTCTLAGWCGKECPHCHGEGHRGRRLPNAPCPVCHGGGRIGVHGPALVEASPLERMRMTDRRPWNAGNHRWGWTNDAADFPAVPWYLPAEIFNRLAGGLQMSAGRVWYKDENTATTAASEAALAWARCR